jgi:type I restriction-modification system DNA methylase subunit
MCPIVFRVNESKTFSFEDFSEVTAYFYSAEESVNLFHDIKKMAYNLRKQFSSMPQDVYLYVMNGPWGITGYLLITERDGRYKHPAWLGIRVYGRPVTDKEIDEIISKSKTFKSIKNSITNSEEHKKTKKAIEELLNKSQDTLSESKIRTVLWSFFAKFLDISGYTTDFDKSCEIAKKLTNDLEGYDNIDYPLLKELMPIYQDKHFTLHDSLVVFFDYGISPAFIADILEYLLNYDSKKRKSTGSYYTPVEIVEFMCEMSFSQYVATHTSLSEAEAEAMIHDLNVSDSVPLERRAEVMKCLWNIRTLDPACGGGAFNIGIVNRFMQLCYNIDNDLSIAKSLGCANTFDVKKHIITTNIYGIDINPLAVTATRMRLFLSLLSEATADDYEKIDEEFFEILKHHIVCADALLDDPFGCLQNRQHKPDLFHLPNDT